ncbi:amidohydrolase family protein [Lysobacter korlensis]|uniref:Amidohydrolase family protein n=1 Tax=Lysobacter korlensis TaxID=553636 RepID=A0ABV6RT58_9GAMM
MILDAHVHVWDPARADYPWLGNGTGGLNRAIGLDELTPTLSRLGIGGVVLVQASDNTEDTDLMLETARRHREVVGVVAWAPLDRPDQLPERLASLTGSLHVVGIRNLIHEREPEWLLRPEGDRSLAELARWEIPLDFVTAGPAALAELPVLRRRHPDLNVVIDHLGKPPIGGAAEERSQWRRLLAEAAADPRTHAKLSGLYSSTGDLGAWTTEQLRPFVDDALELFGAERLMYGGDWPVSDLAGGYDRSWAAMTELLAPLSAHERDAILGGTAERFYALDTLGDE